MGDEEEDGSVREIQRDQEFHQKIETPEFSLAVFLRPSPLILQFQVAYSQSQGRLG